MSTAPREQTPAPDPAPENPTDPPRPARPVSRRAEAWAATMEGHRHASDEVSLAHQGFDAHPGPLTPLTREDRERLENDLLAPGASRSSGAGRRPRDEQPDPIRTCFERDRDRILHGTTAFRRLAGKTQVFIFPEDHQRTRLTHALEVAQVASSIARALRLNVALCEAIALGHDCGHGPGGHASEDAFSPFLTDGYDHAVWGADVVLEPLNLCVETLDGIRNHSWSRPAPSTPEGEVVSWADRIAYVCHDFEDAVHAGIVTADMLPEVVRERCGDVRARQLDAFIGAVITTAVTTGRVGMDPGMAAALAEFRRFNYHNIYMRPASLTQSEIVIRLLRALVEYYSDRPNTLPMEGIDARPNPGRSSGVRAGSPEAVHEAVAWVAGMTDRYAFNMAVEHLGWERSALPLGVDGAH